MCIFIYEINIDIMNNIIYNDMNIIFINNKVYKLFPDIII